MSLRGIQPRSKEEQEKYAEWLQEIDQGITSPHGWNFDDYLYFMALIERERVETRETEIRETAEELRIPKDELDELRVVFRQIDCDGSLDIQKKEVELFLKKLGVSSLEREKRAKELFFQYRSTKEGLTFLDFLRMAKKLNSEPFFFREVTY